MHEIIVNSNCYHGWSIEDAVKGIAGCGYHHIELTSTRGWTEHVVPSMSFSRLLEIRHMLDDYGIDVPAMSGHCNLMDKDRLPDFVENIYLSAFFGARYIVSSIGEAHLKDKATATDELLIKNLDTLIPILESTDQTLVLETHGEHGTARRIMEITGRINNPRIRICYDTANVIFYGDVKGDEDIKAATGWISYLHIKDKAGGRTEWNFPALGDGYVDFPSLFKVLDEKGNNAPFSIEIEFTEKGSSSVDEVNEALRKSAKYLKELGYTL